MKQIKQLMVISFCISICFSFTACTETESTTISDSIKSNAESNLDAYEIDIDSLSESIKEMQSEATDTIENFYSDVNLDTYEIDIESFSESIKEIQGEATDVIGNIYTEAKRPENIDAMNNFMSEAKENVTEFYDTTVPDEYKIEKADLVVAYENLITNAEPIIEVLQEEVSNFDKEEALEKFNDVVQGYSQVYGKILESNTSLFEPVE